MQEISWTHTFQQAFNDFWQKSNFLALLILRKGQGLFFNPENGLDAFLTSKKGQGAFLAFKKREDTPKNTKHEHYTY